MRHGLFIGSDVPLVGGHQHASLAIKALDHYYDYTRAVQREDTEYLQAADYFRKIQRKAPDNR